VLRGYHRHGERQLDVNVFGMLRAEWELGPLREVTVTVEGTPPEAFVRPAAPPS
jgi:[ribosomal protein S5]-alanine N-acetyltransferase